MLMSIILGIYLFSSIGIFIKLRKYGAPMSSFLYSGLIPIGSMIIATDFGYRNIIKRDKKLLKNLMSFLLFEFDCLKHIQLITSLVCIDLGKMNISFFKLLSELFNRIVNKNLKGIMDTTNGIINQIFTRNQPPIVKLRRL